MWFIISMGRKASVHMDPQNCRENSLRLQWKQQVAQVCWGIARPRTRCRTPAPPPRQMKCFIFKRSLVWIISARLNEKQDMTAPSQYLNLILVCPTSLKLLYVITLWTTCNRVCAMSIKIMQAFTRHLHTLKHHAYALAGRKKNSSNKNLGNMNKIQPENVCHG